MSVIIVSDDVTVAAKEEVEVSSSAPGKLSRPVMRSPGTRSRRIRANPLKHLAHLLRQKLIAAHGAPCNMLQVQRHL